MNFLHAKASDGTLGTAVGDVPVSERAHRLLESKDAPQQLILGVRPEHLEDAAVVEDHLRPHGVKFEAPVDLVESMGSEKYAYLPLEGERASTAELEELAADAGTADALSSGAQLVARLPAESTVAEGKPIRL